ncbi:heparan-sulfate 6-O-sulfotransferase 3 [Protopterus annectens]|uniref:heparan-sulfate 6-O-sulfotransferase 3 n=1 Tax=Protopterus annectens TaxID=7888 RepID=UPI001CFC1354|nr:heparan-sulfate 6-O-sulfotransferase 3 [Protopterus annectens]
MVVPQEHPYTSIPVSPNTKEHFEDNGRHSDSKVSTLTNLQRGIRQSNFLQLPQETYKVLAAQQEHCECSEHYHRESAGNDQGHPGNFYYITMLRDPVSRYLSEWKHVQRGATWKASLHLCDGRSPTPDELPTCYIGDDWSGVTLQEFMDCSYNLANNRQVRMLADLSLVGCYNLTFMSESERNEILLQSAKNNLKNMAFFGLTEFQRKTQYLFERTFSLKFISPFTQFNSTRASNVDINERARNRIEELNFLDMQLYDYAKDLFLQRFQYTKQKEHQQERQKRREERRLLREHKAYQRQHPDETVQTITEDYNSQVIRW